MDKSKKPEIYAFIDSQNLNVSTQKFGWKMDWRKFREFLSSKYGVTKAYLFIGYVPEFTEMYEFLHDAGFAIVLKPTFDVTRVRQEDVETEDTKKAEPAEKKPVKGNVDADLVLWTMKEINNYDKAIIVSGDGDFYSLIEYLEKENKLLKVLTPTIHYSGLLKPYDKYIEQLGQYRRELNYRSNKPSPRK